MSEKEIPIVSLQDFLSGPQHTHTPKQIGKQWHAVLEAVLFASSAPLTLDDLRNIIEDLPKSTIHQLLIELKGMARLQERNTIGRSGNRVAVSDPSRHSRLCS